jgi:hypothetical protein
VAGFLSIAQQISSPPYQSSANHAQADTNNFLYRCDLRLSRLVSYHGSHGSFRSTVPTIHMWNISADINVSFSSSAVPMFGSHSSHLRPYQTWLWALTHIFINTADKLSIAVGTRWG